MTRHLSIEWPDPAPFEGRGGAPIRILAVSDQLDPALTDARSRRAAGPIDLIAGCGDLDCDDLSFLADAFDAPLVYILGNHDDESRWQSCESYCPDPIPPGSLRRELGLTFACLTWPGRRGLHSTRSDRGAWIQALRLAVRRLTGRDPVIVLSHVPPKGAGDIPTDAYHRGFAAYRWLMRRLRPPLWLHGHTPLAAASEWHIGVGTTTLVNSTGAVVVELWAPGAWESRPAGRPEPS